MTKEQRDELKKIEIIKEYGGQTDPFVLSGQDPNYDYRWVNTTLDNGERVDRMKGKGWEVDEDEKISSPFLPKGTATKRYREFILMRRPMFISEILREEKNKKYSLERINKRGMEGYIVEKDVVRE